MKLSKPILAILLAGALVACSSVIPAPDMSAQIAGAVTASDRPEADVQRDEARHPAAMLAFSTIKTGDVVADLGTGGGYFARLLSSVVGSGEVYAQNPPFWIENLKGFDEKIQALAGERSNVKRLAAKFDDLGFAPNSLDAVTMMMIYHDVTLLDTDRAKMNADLYAALKPGGVLLITDHHAASGTGATMADSLHRIDAETVMSEVLAAGFVLKAQSDMLSHPDDSRELMVFDPSIRGKTDRFVYLFEKKK
jgi:predicted methyltransferase